MSGAKNQLDNASIFVLCTDNKTGNGDIYFKRSVESGIRFGGTQNLVNVLFRITNDSGLTFAKRNTLGKDVGDFADFTKMATMPGGPQSGMNNDAYVVRSNILINRESTTSDIFFQTITNNGTAISDTINLSDNDGDSIMPNIAISNNGNVYLACGGDNTRNRDVYFTLVY